jgi:DNA repair exonuclease SbcCD ATPase subunit
VSLAVPGRSGDVEVVRSAGQLSVTAMGQTVEGARPAAEHLARAIGLPPSLLGVLAYRPQGEQGVFLSMSDEEKKSFMSDLLGLAPLEAAAAAAAEAADRLGKAEAEALAAAEIAEALAGREPEGLGVDVSRSRLAELEALDATLRGELEAARQGLEAAAEEADERLAVVLAPLREAAAAAERQLSAVRSKEASFEDPQAAAQLRECRDRRGRLEAEDAARQRVHANVRANMVKLHYVATHAKTREVPRLEAELAAVRGQMALLCKKECPTCLRAWDDTAPAVERLAAEEGLIAAQLEAARSAAESVTDLERWDLSNPWEPDPKVAAFLELERQLETGLAASRARVRAEALAEEGRLEAELRSLEQSAQLARMASAQYPRRAELEAARDTARVRCAASSESLAAARRELAAAEERSRRAEEVREEARRLRDAHRAAKAAAAAERDFSDLVGRRGFLGAIFDEALLEVADDANRILASVANVRHLSVSFRSEVATKRGEARRSIAMAVRVGGQELVGAEVRHGISGGQLSAVRLAVDLALLSVVERRTGLRVGWLVLDEAFDGLGVVEKETCLEVLRGVSSDRLVLVVDHSSEMGELFSREVVVEHRDGESWIAS